VTTEQLIYVAVALILGVISLVGALVAWRVLARAGAALRALEDSASGAVANVPVQLAKARSVLAQADALTERALWSLSSTDQRVDVASANLKARRDASDRLRARLIEGRTTLSRLRETVRALMRLNEMRRTFWA